MKKGDLLWLMLLIAIGAILIIPGTHIMFVALTQKHPYIMGFIKVGILAIMGELLAIRILSGSWNKPIGFFWRFIIWGFFGMAFAMMFPLFDSGVHSIIKADLLPEFKEGILSRFMPAFFISAIMNLTFAPTFMGFHRITDTYIDLSEGKVKNLKHISLVDVVSHIDWKTLVGFVYTKTIPLFWIPAHTITFLLPSEYRVLMASFLSVALGGILAYSRRNK